MFQCSNDVIINVPMFFVVRFQNFGRFAFLLPQVTVSTDSSNFGSVFVSSHKWLYPLVVPILVLFASHKCLHTLVGPN